MSGPLPICEHDFLAGSGGPSEGLKEPGLLVSKKKPNTEASTSYEADVPTVQS